MKTKEKYRGVYDSPKANEISISTEGLLCASLENLNFTSFEKLNDEFNYTWED